MMEVRDFIKSCNRSNPINLTSVYETKKKYLSLYRANMVLLYDQGFISDPTCFDEREIRKNIRDFQITGMVRNPGLVSLTSEQVGFSECKNKNISEEGKEFLSILKKVLYYRERSSDIDKFFDSLYPVKKAVSLGLASSGPEIYLKKKFRVSESILECFYQKETMGKVVKRKTFYNEIFDMALKELGLNEDDSDGLFIKGFTREEEIQYCNLILDGLVSINGSKGVVLEDWLKGHVWNIDIDDKYRYLKTGLFKFVETQKTDFMFRCQKKLLNDTIEKVGAENVLCITTDSIYYTEDAEETDFPISNFVVFAGEDDTISCDDRNVLEGYTGEVYPIDYIEQVGGVYIGCPIELYLPGSDEKVLVVDFEQTSYYTPGGKNTSWFSYEEGASLTFGRSLYQKGIFDTGSLEDTLFRIYGDSESGKVIGKIPAVKSTEDEGKLKNSKKKVYEMVIEGERLKNRRDGLECLEKGLLEEGIHFLSKEFSKSQINVLYKAFKLGLPFDSVWNVANPIFSVDVMKELIEGVKE